MPQGHALQAPANTGFFAAMVADPPASAGRCARPESTASRDARMRRPQRTKRAGHTMGTASIDYNATEAALNTTGMFFKFYRDHFGSVPVEVGGNSPPPAPLYPVGADQPKVNAGSPTYPVDVSAALTSDGKFLTVAVINANESAQAFDLGIRGIALSGKGR